jgi:hypothetical protein
MSQPEVRPLWIHIEDWKRVPLEALKAAKASLDLPYKIVPEWLDPNILPGARVLAIGSKPKWICDYWLIADRPEPIELARALGWALGETAASPRATTVVDILQDAMPGTREILPEELESERRLRAFVNRED